MTEWQLLASEKRYEISRDFESLTPIQRTILIELAHQPFDKPTSKAVIQRLRSSTSGITNALDGLLKHDHIYKDEKGIYHKPETEKAITKIFKEFDRYVTDIKQNPDKANDQYLLDAISLVEALLKENEIY